MDKLEMLKVLVPDETDENVLQTYLELAESEILRYLYPYKNELPSLPSRYNTFVVQTAQYNLNKRGAEGQTSHSENGITRVYETAGIPDSVKSQLVPHVGVL